MVNEVPSDSSGRYTTGSPVVQQSQQKGRVGFKFGYPPHNLRPLGRLEVAIKLFHNAKKKAEWRSRVSKSSVSRPPMKWTDAIRRVAGSCWIQAAQDRGIWNSLKDPCPAVDVNRLI
ncbi:jg8899 [Pararge aegeria aegeria]|uniref:Jg8899 protein n=1 Tax=Pararge aegeria aegeria TaxID=348720 RepID=A0A8S4SN03_9NEOP|nr:jg8899 [Pararge aegeria aegeria]